jgi:hypothetical protein
MVIEITYSHVGVGKILDYRLSIDTELPLTTYYLYRLTMVG